MAVLGCFLNCLISPGLYLSGMGWSDTGNIIERENRGSFEKAYLNNKTLCVLSGLGIVIAGVGVLMYLSSLGHMPMLLASLHLNAQSTHALMIAGVCLKITGGAVSGLHLCILGLKGVTWLIAG